MCSACKDVCSVSERVRACVGCVRTCVVRVGCVRTCVVLVRSV